MNETKPVLVAAGDYRQFILWCRVNHINPNQAPKRALYLSSYHDVQGRREHFYTITGTFWLRRDWHDIMDALMEIGAKEDVTWKST